MLGVDIGRTVAPLYILAKRVLVSKNNAFVASIDLSFLFFGVSDPLFLSSSLALYFCSDYSFWVHQIVNRDDWHLLAHAMASDFSVAWLCLSKRTIGSLDLTLNAFVFVFAVGLELSFLGWGYKLAKTKPFILQNGTLTVISQYSI
jgi:hypothetical protein